MLPSDEAAAIEACRNGDRNAFRRLVEQYEREAMGHALALLRHREDALDAVQEAFLDAFRALDAFDVRRRFYPWFYTLLRHRCFKARSRRNRHGTEEAPADRLLAAVGHDPADRDALEVALASLSAEDREILMLRHLDGLSYDELSARLEIPRGTVMSRLHHARRRLRQRWESAPDTGPRGKEKP